MYLVVSPFTFCTGQAATHVTCLERLLMGFECHEEPHNVEETCTHTSVYICFMLPPGLYVCLFVMLSPGL